MASWKPVAEAANGSGVGFKRPDLLLLKEGAAPTVVEFELNIKSTTKQYVRLLEAYNRAIKAGDFANPILYVTAEVASNRRSITTSLDAALRSANLLHKMTVSFLILEIDTLHWNPRSAQNGYFKKVPRAPKAA